VPRRTQWHPDVAPYDLFVLLTMTAHPTHRITPAMIGNRPWPEGSCWGDDTRAVGGGARMPPGEVGDGAWSGGMRSGGVREAATMAWGSRHHRIARLALRPQPCSAVAARDFTRAALRDWDTGEVFADAAVVISELVTNAIRHGLSTRPPSATAAGSLAAGSPADGSSAAGSSADASSGDGSPADGRIELVLLRVAGALVCLVTDPNPEAPVLLEPDYTAERGRGLRIVDGLSSRWGWTPLGDGCKAVWAALPVA
jgi:hypothetical protein